MKNVASILFLLAVGCAAKSKSQMSTQATAAPEGIATSSPRAQITQLDAAISADMEKLAIARPTAPPLTCAGAACAQEMSGVAAAATAPAGPSCKPAQTTTCTDACALKESICSNAGRICQLAADLGGTDAYANDKCNQGNASCEAAKQRCCGCM